MTHHDCVLEMPQSAKNPAARRFIGLRSNRNPVVFRTNHAYSAATFVWGRIRVSEKTVADYDAAEALAIARLRAQDDEFSRRLRLAIELGRESCPIGVSTEPSTQNPIFMKHKSPESYY